MRVVSIAILCLGVGLLPAVFSQDFSSFLGVLTAPNRVLIVHGNDVYSPEKYPWQVFIELNNGTNQCGGSLISNEWILSAAHCFDGGSSITKIVMGTVRKNGNGDGAVFGTAEKVLCHKNYDTETLDYDICLIKLHRPVVPGPNLRPIALPTRETQLASGTTCSVTGWGYDAEIFVSLKMASSQGRPVKRRDALFVIPSPMRLVLRPSRPTDVANIEELPAASGTDTESSCTESGNDVEILPEMTKFLTRQPKVPEVPVPKAPKVPKVPKVPERSVVPASEPQETHVDPPSLANKTTRISTRILSDKELDLIAIYRSEALVQYMGGEYEAARKSLEKAARLMATYDLHDLLLMAECTVLLWEDSRDYWVDFQVELVASNVSNDRIKRWAGRFFPRQGHNVDSLRSIGGVLVLCGLMKKYEREGILCVDYVNELRDFLVGLDGVAHYVIKRNFHRRFELEKFFSDVRNDLRSKLVEYNKLDAVDQACLDHGAITNHCVQEDYPRALDEAVWAIKDIERNQANPSKYKIYARLLMWRGILRVTQGEVDRGIVDMEKAKSAMADATDYFDDSDMEYLMSLVDTNIRYARKGKANLKTLQADMYHAASSPVRPRVVYDAVKPQAMSGAAKPREASGPVEPQAARGAGKLTAVTHKASAKVKSPRSKSKSRKSK